MLCSIMMRSRIIGAVKSSPKRKIAEKLQRFFSIISGGRGFRCSVSHCKEVSLDFRRKTGTLISCFPYSPECCTAFPPRCRYRLSFPYNRSPFLFCRILSKILYCIFVYAFHAIPLPNSIALLKVYNMLFLLSRSFQENISPHLPP